MSDLINRQDAIDAVADLYWMDERLLNFKKEIDATFDKIKALPSAQPEIIHCRECVYGEQDCDGWWYCISFGCQVGDEDGSGFCSDAERNNNV